MTFLELVNALRRECSVSGSGVTTVANQTGESKRLVEWIQQAHEDVQNYFFDWRFLKKTATFTTQNTTNIIQPPADLNIWDLERLYDSSGNEVEFVEYADVRELIDPTVIGEPTRFILKNDNTLLADPYPDAAYEFTYDYFRSPQVLSADNDEPLIPVQFQRAIIGRAMMYYGNYESATEIKQQGAELFEYTLSKLVANQTATKQQFYGRSDSMDIRIEVE